MRLPGLQWSPLRLPLWLLSRYCLNRPHRRPRLLLLKRQEKREKAVRFVRWARLQRSSGALKMPAHRSRRPRSRRPRRSPLKIQQERRRQWRQLLLTQLPNRQHRLANTLMKRVRRVKFVRPPRPGQKDHLRLRCCRLCPRTANLANLVMVAMTMTVVVGVRRMPLRRCESSPGLILP